MNEKDWQFFLNEGAEDSPYSEYSLLCFSFSDALMDFDRVLIHGVALRWRDHAYLICGPSGVGKSTQARFLQELRPGEFGVICGDRPVLQFCQSDAARATCPPSPVPDFRHCEPVTDVTGAAIRPPVPVGALTERPPALVQSLPPGGKVSRPEAVTDEGPEPVTDEVGSRQEAVSSGESKNEGPPHPSSGFRETPESTFPSRGRRCEGPILVHPSPWNGKENWYGAEAAPLAGLILLERGDENRLCTLSPREAALAIYSQIIQTCVTAEGIRKAADLTTRLLNAVPIWKLTTHQVPDSTRLLLDAVF